MLVLERICSKDKNHIIILIDVEKVFDKIQPPYMIKTQKKLGTESLYLYIIKAIHHRFIVNLIPNGKKSESISS
jgi:hypothetical protein